MKRFSAFLVLLLSTITLAQSKGPTTQPTNTPAVNFSGVSFKDAVEYFADISGANIVVNWKALEKANVMPDTQINMKVGGVSMRKALELMLRQAGGETPLTYTIDEGVIEITTQATADEKLVTRTYGIQDLLFEPVDATNAPQLSLQNSGGGGSGGRGGGGGGGNSTLFNTGGTGGNTGNNGRQALSQQEKAEEIIKMITSTVRPEIWQENGGTSKISYYRGKLIVTSPQSVHRLIGG